jgi:hypothetical protein
MRTSHKVEELVVTATTLTTKISSLVVKNLVSQSKTQGTATRKTRSIRSSTALDETLVDPEAMTPKPHLTSEEPDKH